MAKLKFPKNFLWGGATSAEQLEGRLNTKKGRTKWDIHFEKFPEDFFEGVGPGITSDFANRWKEDISLWKESVGVNSVRTSFSWALLFPDGETLNEEGVNFYHKVLDEMILKGIKPIINLFHFDLPEWAYNIGGWESKDVINKFTEFAAFCFDEYDSKVEMFTTMNEPIVPIYAGYLGYGGHLPGIYDPQRAFNAGNGTILAHAKSVNAFNSTKRKSKIGVILNVSPSHARNKNDLEDLKAADNFHLIHNLWMLDPMIKGEFTPGLKELFSSLGASEFNLDANELEEIKNIKLDFIGTNFYFPTRLKKYEGEKVNNEIEKIAMHWQDPDARMNKHRGWEIFPEDIYNTAQLIKERYNNIPFYISENGMGVQNEDRFRNEKGFIDDKYRIAFISEHLEYIHKAIEDGSNIFGYHLWAIEDCWSWLNAYKNRYGFIEIDLKTQERIPKLSASWFKNLTKQNYLDSDYEKLDDNN